MAGKGNTNLFLRPDKAKAYYYQKSSYVWPTGQSMCSSMTLPGMTIDQGYLAGGGTWQEQFEVSAELGLLPRCHTRPQAAARHVPCWCIWAQLRACPGLAMLVRQ